MNNRLKKQNEEIQSDLSAWMDGRPQGRRRAEGEKMISAIVRRLKQDYIRDKSPIGIKKFSELSCNDKRILLWGQLKQLGSISKQPKITCLCGRTNPVEYMYRCQECGIYFCPPCAKEHFKKESRREKERKE